jgi:hypothetical protein
MTSEVIELLSKLKYAILTNMNKDKHIIPDDDSTTRIARPCRGCGEHQTIAGAVLNSKEWQAWYDYASAKMLYDVDECLTIDAMSDDHWNDFIKFTIKNHEKENK